MMRWWSSSVGEPTQTALGDCVVTCWLAGYSDVLTGYLLNIDQISSDRVFQCFISFNRSIDLSIETSTGLA